MTKTEILRFAQDDTMMLHEKRSNRSGSPGYEGEPPLLFGGKEVFAKEIRDYIFIYSVNRGVE